MSIFRSKQCNPYLFRTFILILISYVHAKFPNFISPSLFHQCIIYLCSSTVFSVVGVAQSLVFSAMFRRPLFVFLSFSLWPMYCLSFLLPLITTLVSSNVSYIDVRLLLYCKSDIYIFMHCMMSL